MIPTPDHALTSHTETNLGYLSRCSGLISDTLTIPIWRQGHSKDVIIHSDQSSTYASSGYQQLLHNGV